MRRPFRLAKPTKRLMAACANIAGLPEAPPTQLEPGMYAAGRCAHYLMEPRNKVRLHSQLKGDVLVAVMGHEYRHAAQWLAMKNDNAAWDRLYDGETAEHGYHLNRYERDATIIGCRAVQEITGKCWSEVDYWVNMEMHFYHGPASHREARNFWFSHFDHLFATGEKRSYPASVLVPLLGEGQDVGPLCAT